MDQRRDRSSHRRRPHRHYRRSIFKFLLLVVIGVIFIYFTPTTDYFLTTKTIGRVSKATTTKNRTTTTNRTKAKVKNRTDRNTTNDAVTVTNNSNKTKNPILEIKTRETMKNKKNTTSTPPSPFQKQYILQINYHKTGHAISYQYRTILRKLLQGKNSNSNFDSDNELLSTIMTANSSIHTLKRTHSNETTGGCPTKQQFWNTLLMNKTTTTETDSNTILINYVNAGSLDLFCNIEENDLFNTHTHNKKDGDDNSDGNGNKNGNGVSHEQPQNQNHHHDIKIIHLIRDPIDMVVSAYLYHSQRPTPEIWVKKKHGVFYNPCNLNYDIIQFYDRLKSSTEEDFSEQQFDTIISQKDGQQIEGLCQTLMYNNNTKQPYRHFYEALTKLSSIHGLQLMTIQLLVSNFHSGSDLLRMVLNIIRLNQWSSDRNNMKNKNKNNKILTLEMGNDWSFNYTDTVTRTTQFIVEDLEDLLVLQQQQQQQQHKSNSSTNNFELLKAMTKSKQKFITTVTSLMKEQKQKVKIRNNKHFTTSSGSTSTKWSSKEEKDTIIEQLLSDELLGPILFKLQQVTNNAIGLTKHQ